MRLNLGDFRAVDRHLAPSAETPATVRWWAGRMRHFLFSLRENSLDLARWIHPIIHRPRRFRNSGETLRGSLGKHRHNGFAIRREHGEGEKAENPDYETTSVDAGEPASNLSHTNSRSTLGDSCADSDPRLAFIIGGWSKLSEEAKSALVAVFNASR